MRRLSEQYVLRKSDFAPDGSTFHRMHVFGVCRQKRAAVVRLNNIAHSHLFGNYSKIYRAPTVELDPCAIIHSWIVSRYILVLAALRAQC